MWNIRRKQMCFCDITTRLSRRDTFCNANVPSSCLFTKGRLHFIQLLFWQCIYSELVLLDIVMDSNHLNLTKRPKKRLLNCLFHRVIHIVFVYFKWNYTAYYPYLLANVLLVEWAHDTIWPLDGRSSLIPAVGLLVSRQRREFWLMMLSRRRGDKHTISHEM